LNIPAELGPAWPCYRLVVEHLATWTEVTETMSIDDVDEVCVVADAHFDATQGGVR